MHRTLELALPPPSPWLSLRFPLLLSWEMLIRKPSALAHSEGIQSQPREPTSSEAKWEGTEGSSLVPGSRWTKVGVGVGGAGSAPLFCAEFKNRAKGELGVTWHGQMPSPHSGSVRGSQESSPSCGFQDLSLIKPGQGPCIPGAIIKTTKGY